MIVEELLKLSIDYKYDHRQRTTNKCEQFSVGFTVRIYVFLGLVDEKFAQKRGSLGVDLVRSAKEFL